MSVEVTVEGPVWTVSMDRRERRNAVDREQAMRLVEAFERFEADGEARVAVLHGAGGDFCSGADLKALAEGRGNRLEAEGEGPMGPTRMTLDKPVIAAVEGHAVAGGLELALWCDLRVATEEATFGVYCRRLGVPLIDGGTYRLPRMVGMGRAMDMILTGRAVDAHEAYRIGLCDRLVEQGQALAKAQELALEIAAFPQGCMRADRKSAYAHWGREEGEALAEEFRRGVEVIDEARQGAQKFMDGQGRGGRFDQD